MAGAPEHQAEIGTHGRLEQRDGSVGILMANDNAGYQRFRTFDFILLAVAVTAFGLALFFA
jgi:hypothetical protein